MSLLSIFGLTEVKTNWWTIMQMNHNSDHMYGTGGHRAQPCRACSDFTEWTQMQNKNKTVKKDPKDHYRDCPLSRDQLGRNTWSLLHTIAAYYPTVPSSEQQKDMKQFIDTFSRLYPCEHCAQDFRKDISTDPPQTGSQTQLSQWFCRIHNKVNEKLGKKLFDCKAVDERWLKGWADGSCD